MNFQKPTLTPAMPSARVRALWQRFEQSQAKDRAQLDIAVQDALNNADLEWNETSINNRMSKKQHTATKAKTAKDIQTAYFEQAREKWHRKLECSGLKAEFWTDLTKDEKRRIAYTLGSNDKSDQDLVVPELPPAPIVQPTQTPSFQPLSPSFSTSSRATNLSSSSYALVNPSELNSEEEDFEFEIPSSNPVATSVDLTSEEDDDAAFSILNYPVTRPSHVGSGFSRASSSQQPISNPAKPPSTRPLASGFAYNAGSSGAVPAKRPQPSQNEAKSAPAKARIPRQPYVGPSLDAPDEPINEELEFEKFKMKTRMEKIAEFHETAALAEITLSIEIYKARKQSNNSKEEDAPRVLEHQKRMVQLQKEKEEERKAIVKSERARRQSELGRRSTRGDLKEAPMSSDAFKTWDLSSFQKEVNLPSRFNLDTLLSDDPAKQQTNVEGLLSKMFAGDYQVHSEPEASAGLFNSSSTSSNQDAVRGLAHTQEQLRQSPPSMSWNKPRSNPSPKPPRKTHHSLFGDSSDEENDGPAAVRNSKDNTGWGIDKPNAKPTASTWNNKPNTPTPVVAGARSSKNVHTTSVSSVWNSKEATPITQPYQGTNILSNINPFVADDIKHEPTATPVINSKVAKGKKPWAPASDKSSVLPPTVETTAPSSKTPAAETPAIPPTPAAPAPAQTPVGKKQNKKQRQVDKKEGAVATPAVAAETAIPEQEPKTEPVLPQRWSPKLETPAPVPEPVSQGSEYTSWLPKMGLATARAGMDSGSGSTTPSFNWDEVTSTPRPAQKIPAHLQAMMKPEATPRPNMFKKQNLMAEVSNATSSRTTLDQMPPASIARGSVWNPAVTVPSPGPSLWEKTKADFETVKATKQSTGSEFWIPEGFDGVNDEGAVGDGGGGGGGDEDIGVGVWEPIAARSKQTGMATSIPVKQKQLPVAAQQLRRVSETTSSSTPRALDTKDLSDIGEPTPPTGNSNSKKAMGKANGKGKQRATIEDVSDEGNDNIDVLPRDYKHIMELKVIPEPEPSVPTAVYNPIIDSADNRDVNDNRFASSSSRPAVLTASSSSAGDIFGSDSRFSNGLKTHSANTSMNAEWGAIGGKHARWTPAVSHETEKSGSPNSSAPFASRLPAKPSVQQTPIWGQLKKDKGKGKMV